MIRYNSPWDWLCSFAPIELSLMLGAVASFVCVFFVVFRRRPVRPAFFSLGFVLALCPFICASLLAVLRVQDFLDGRLFDPPQYVTGRLQGPVTFAIVGAWASAAALLAYSIAYGVNSKSRSA